VQVLLAPPDEMMQRNIASGYFRRILRAPRAAFERRGAPPHAPRAGAGAAAPLASRESMMLPSASAVRTEVMAYLGDKAQVSRFTRTHPLLLPSPATLHIPLLTPPPRRAQVEQREVEALHSQIRRLRRELSRDHSLDRSMGSNGSNAPRWDEDALLDADALSDAAADGGAVRHERHALEREGSRASAEAEAEAEAETETALLPTPLAAAVSGAYGMRGAPPPASLSHTPAEKFAAAELVPARLAEGAAPRPSPPCNRRSAQRLLHSSGGMKQVKVPKTV
jgi:hypothetical protein